MIPPISPNIKSLDLMTTSAIDRTYEDGQFKKEDHAKNFIAADVGALASLVATTTGPMVYLHEGGHALAALMTRNFKPGNGPTIQVDGFDNFWNMVNADTIPEQIKNFFIWLAGLDSNSDGSAGVTRIPRGTLNSLGEMLGPDGTSAFISLAGSIPGLVIDSALVSGGMLIRKDHPVLGYLMLGAGTTNHLINITYPWHATLMSETELTDNAKSGHDFANFALKFSKITNVSPKMVALTTALVWTGIVPLIILGIFLYQKKQKLEMVTDYQALTHWLQKSSTQDDIKDELTTLMKSYPKYDKLQKIENNWPTVTKKDFAEIGKFVEYLTEKLPKKTIKAEKIEILKGWEKFQQKDRIEDALQAASLASYVSDVALKLFDVLGKTIVPALTPVASVLTYASPIFSTVTVISSGYETYKDIKSDRVNVPKLAKVISVAKLITAVATTTVLIIGLFVPGANLFIICGVVLGTSTMLILGVWKHSIIKKRFVALQAIDDNHFNVMSPRLKGRVKLSKLKKQKNLYRWYKSAQKAKKDKLLKDNKLKTFNQITIINDSKINKIVKKVLIKLRRKLNSYAAK